MKSLGIAVAALLMACAGETNTGVVAHGTIEVDEITLAPMVASRVVSIAVDEGDAVQPGDTVAVLTQATLAAVEAAE
ncbi:MAG: biotin/lipoyl-binding protein, partial [Gemmatimonadota bacterium]|nr:biotin/lipoyl-binding protein [Gemmatimonadota bacterium]